jgi:hypothetical protein
MPGLASQFTRLDVICALLERCGAYGESRRARCEIRAAQTNAHMLGIIEKYEEMAARLSARAINPPSPIPLQSFLNEDEQRERREID